MKIAIIIRPTAFVVKGGDTVQAVETARHLSLAGITADIWLANSNIPYDQYDLFHFFNLTRPADALKHVKNISRPFVISPIWIDYSSYDQNYRGGLSGRLFKHLSGQKIEYVKNIGRWLLRKEVSAHFSYILKGHKRSVQYLLNRSALLLPNSDQEQNRLAKDYPHLPRHITIPNGVDDMLFKPCGNVRKRDHLVLCVGRIEGIKNQFNLIQALNNTLFELLVIGSAAPNQADYYKACRKTAAANVTFIEHLPQEELVKYYQQARVHVLPSWFETCGLSSLEAAAMGCNIVITDKGYTREYYEDYAFYCDPANPASIGQAVEKAAEATFPEALRTKIFTNYTWRKAAEKTLEAYQQVIQ